MATTPGFAASRDSTGIPALSAMAKKVSPFCTLVVFVAEVPRVMSGSMSNKGAARALLRTE